MTHEQDQITLLASSFSLMVRFIMRGMMFLRESARFNDSFWTA